MNDVPERSSALFKQQAEEFPTMIDVYPVDVDDVWMIVKTAIDFRASPQSFLNLGAWYKCCLGERMQKKNPISYLKILYSIP